MHFQDELFDSGEEIFELNSGRLVLKRNFLNKSTAERTFFTIKEKTLWESTTLFIAGRHIPVPRLNAWYADEGMTYTYSGVKLQPSPWYEELAEIRNKLFEQTQVKYNSCLLNLYRDGNDSVAWHCDDEPELGRNPLIASLSFGTERKFVMRSLTDKNEKLTIKLPHNSLLTMEGEIQHRYEHMVPKEKGISEARVNLTFRQIKH